MPALISWVNWLDRSSSVITASSQAGNLDPTRLAEPQLRARWRTAAGVVTPQMDVDFGASRQVGIIALAQPDDAGGVDADREPRGWMAASDTVRHRLDVTTAGAGAVLDTRAAQRNLLTWTEQFDNAAWIKGEVTVSADFSPAPNGTTTAGKITASAVNTAHFVQSVQNVVGGTTYTFSFFAKASEYSFTALLFAEAGFGTNTLTLFNLATGVVVANPTGNATITSIGNGWFRCSDTRTATATTLVALQIRVQNNATTNDYAGDGTSGILIWGAQLETGSTATPYQRVAAMFDGDIEGGWRAGYGIHIHQPASPLTARYWRCNLNAASLASVPGFVDLGRAWAGPVWTPSRGNIAYGFGETWTDGAQVERNPRSGLEFVDVGPRARVLNFAFSALTESDAAQIRELQRVAGSSGQVLFAPFPGEGAERAAPIIGRLTEVPPITLPRYARYAVAFQIRQSL